MSAANKQRLVRMTRAEKRAAITGGAVDDRIPKKLLLRRLSAEPGIAFEVTSVLEMVSRAASRCRGFSIPGERGCVVPPRMEPAKLVAQARETVAVIDELRERLSHMHPNIECWANDALYRSQSTHFCEVTQRMEPDLLRIRAAIDHAARILKANGGRTGPKNAVWQIARASVAEALREHSVPRMSISRSKALSADLLALCGLQSGRKERSTTSRSDGSPKPL